MNGWLLSTSKINVILYVSIISILNNSVEKYNSGKVDYSTMASSIKVKDSTKIELEKLQARLLLEYNKKLNQQEIIDILVSLGKKNPILLIKKANTINKSIFKKMEKRISSWKLPTDPNVIDDILYGEN